MARVVLDNVGKSFKGPRREEIHAVRDVSLVIEDREFLVLVGPSGCGKSTLLRLIAGLEELTQGAISIDGRDVSRVEPKDRDVAMVFQNYALYPHMTVFENMAFGLKLRRVPKADIERRVLETAATLGLTALLDRLPKELSGGQRQRVAVGRAIVRQPKAFLFDEPLSNLDAQMRVQTRLEISRLHKRLAATMIYVTHDQVEAMTMGDRIAVMNGGRVQQVDGPLPLYQRPTNLFVAGFIGSPPMNFFHGVFERTPAGWLFRERDPSGSERLHPFSVRFDGTRNQLAAERSGKPAILGLRPEDLALGPSNGAPPSNARIEARVELIEPLGAETYLHLATAAHRVVARVGSDQLVRVDDRIQIQLNLDKAHFFDPTTGERL